MNKPYKIGDRVLTEYNGYVQQVSITEVSTDEVCRSGHAYRVAPPLDARFHDMWFDHEWFYTLDDNDVDEDLSNAL